MNARRSEGHEQPHESALTTPHAQGIGYNACRARPPRTTGVGTPQSRYASEQEDARSERPETNKPRIVLVHGAWADGTGWQHIIPLLEDDGFPVISGAADNPNVKALVYLAAFAPDASEPVGALLGQFPATRLGAAFVPDTAGFVYIDRAKFRDIFAADVDRTEARLMAAAQKPASGAIFGQSAAVAAWRTIPAWYLVSKQDQTLHLDMQRFYGRRMGATTSEIDASHVAFISRPKAIARLIEKATKAVG
jgi:pimeloyl-ACP methyl ester carboxylesterase